VTADDQDQIIMHAREFGRAQEHDMLKPMIKGVRDKLTSQNRIKIIDLTTPSKLL
jgi:hypothetical protein